MMPDDPIEKLKKTYGIGAPTGGGGDAARAAAMKKGADELGIDPVDYATAISYESARSFNPWRSGPVTKWGRHRGTIQYGEPQQKKYGVHPNQTFEDQVSTSNVQYLKDHGVKPGMKFAQIYAAINGGSADKDLNTKDWNTGRTIADNIKIADSEHRPEVLKRFGQYFGGPSPDQPKFDYDAAITKVTGGNAATPAKGSDFDYAKAITEITGATPTAPASQATGVKPGQPPAPSPTNPTNAMAPPQAALPFDQPEPPIETLGGTATVPVEAVPTPQDEPVMDEGIETLMRIGEAAKAGVRYSDVEKQQEALQQRFAGWLAENQRPRDEASIVEFNKLLAAEHDEIEKKRDFDFLGANPDYAKFLKDNGLKISQETVDQYNEQQRRTAKQGQRAKPAVPVKVLPPDPPPSLAAPAADPVEQPTSEIPPTAVAGTPTDVPAEPGITPAQAVADEPVVRDIPEDFKERITFQNKPADVSNKEYFIQNLIPRIASRTGYDAADIEAELRRSDFDTLGQGLIAGKPLSKIGKDEFYDFQMTPEMSADIAKRSADKFEFGQKKAVADADFELRKASIDPNLSAADRDLEAFRLRGLADIDAGIIDPVKATEAYEALKKDVETWKNDRGFLGIWNQAEWADMVGGSGKNYGENFEELPDSPGGTPKDVIDQAYADMQKQYGNATNWVKTQKEFKKRFESAPLSYLAKTAESAAGGVMKVPFQGAASALETIAIASEAIERGTGGIIGDPADPAAEKKISYRLAQDLRDLAEGVQVDKDFKGGNAELFGNVAGQVVVQAILAAATGGAAAPALFGAAQGVSEQYREAGKFEGITPWKRLGAALVGGLVEAPDYFIFKGMLKGGDLLGKASALQNLKATVQRGLTEKGMAAPFAEKAAVEVTDGFLAEMIAKGGWKATAAKAADLASSKTQTGAFEFVQESTTQPINDMWAYLSYDPSPERWQKATTPTKQNFVEGVAGFFGGIFGASIADIAQRAESLSPEALEQAEELAEEHKDELPAETHKNIITVLSKVLGKRAGKRAAAQRRADDAVGSKASAEIALEAPTEFAPTHTDPQGRPVSIEQLGQGETDQADYPYEATWADGTQRVIQPNEINHFTAIADNSTTNEAETVQKDAESLQKAPETVQTSIEGRKQATPKVDTTDSSAVEIAKPDPEVVENVATDAAHDAATSPLNDLPEPTEAQIEAGNYRKGHLKINGLDISIENPVGSERKGVDRTGKPWSVTMKENYGYLKRSTGADEENIDVFVKDGTPADFAGDVYVIDQVTPDTGKFDEHKALIGYGSEQAARDAYAANYAKDWKGLKAITAMPFKEFKTWSRGSEATAPVAEIQPKQTTADERYKAYKAAKKGQKQGPKTTSTERYQSQKNLAQTTDTPQKIGTVSGENTPGPVSQSESTAKIKTAAAPKPSTLSRKEELSENVILARFSKSGEWSKYNRKFHNLTKGEKVRAIENIRAGDDPDVAIGDAKGYTGELGDAATARRALPPNFFLQLEKAVATDMPVRAPVNDVRGLIEKRATKGEIEKSGVHEFLNTQPNMVERQAVIEFLKAQNPNLKVVVKDDSSMDARTHFGAFTSGGGTNYQEMFVTAPDESVKWHQGHREFEDVENPIVHLRTKEGEDADGTAALRVEELQDVDLENQKIMPPAYRKYAKEIGIKYALQYAYDNDIDVVTFTKGAVQNLRSSVAKELQSLAFEKDGDAYRVEITELDGSVFTDRVAEEKFDEYFSKNLAKAIRDAGESGEFAREEIAKTDPDLTYAYETIQRKLIQKHAKRLGGKFSESEIRTDDGTEPVYRVDLTPTAKSRLAEGQSLFFPGETKSDTPKARRMPDPSGFENDSVADDETHARALVEVRMPLELEAQPGFEKSKVSHVDVIKSYAKILKDMGRPTPVRMGRISQKNARGVYKPGAEVIRLREAGNIPTAAHEVFHAVQKVMFGAANAKALKPIPTAALRELVQLGKDLYGDTKPNGGYRTEGFAEFGRLYLTQDSARTKAPMMYRYFVDEFLENNPDFKKSINKAKETTVAYQQQGAENRASANMSQTSIRQRIENIISKVKSQFPTLVIDELTPLLNLSKDVEKLTGTKLPAGENPGMVASYLRGNAQAKTHFMVMDGMIDAAGNRVGPSLSDAVAKVRRRQTDFVHYLWAKRALERWSQNKNPGMSKEDAAFLVENLASPEFELAAQGVYEWNAGVLNYVKGMLPDMGPTIDKILETSINYVPLMREMNDIEAGDIAGKYKGFGGNAMFQMKGSGRRVKNIFPQMIANAERMLTMAHKRKVLDTIARLEDLEGVGSLLERVPRELVPNTVILESIEKSLLNAGADLSDVDLDTAVTFFTPAEFPKGKDPIVPIMRDGKMQWYQVPADLYNTLSGLDLYRLPWVADLLLGAPTRLFRLGTTGLRASFGLFTNPTRDIQTVFVQSQAKNPAKLMLNYFKAIGGAFNPKRLAGENSAALDTFYRLGVNLAQPLGADEAITTKFTKQVFQSRPRRIISSPVNALREVFSVSESIPRVAELESIGREIGWKPGEPMTFDQAVQIGLASKQSTVDFSASGKAGKMVNQTVPFFNANVQGTRSFARAFQRNPTGTVLKGLLGILLPTLLLWWKNKDEPWFVDMPDREKNMYWNIQYNDKILQIPRAQEFGGLFASLPESIVDSWYRKDPEGFKASMGYLFDLATPPDPITGSVIGKNAKEQWQNRIDFFDKPIVPKAEENLPPSEQVGQYTSEVAKFLGGILPDYKIAGIPINSPRRIDALIRGVGGGVAADIAQAGNTKSPSEWEASDIPVVGRAFRRGGTMGTGSKAVDKFYDELTKARQRQSSKENPETPEEEIYRKQLEHASQTLADLRKEATNASADKKREIAERGRSIAFLVVRKESPIHPSPGRSDEKLAESKQKQANERLSEYFPDQTLIEPPESIKKVNQLVDEARNLVKGNRSAEVVKKLNQRLAAKEITPTEYKEIYAKSRATDNEYELQTGSMEEAIRAFEKGMKSGTSSERGNLILLLRAKYARSRSDESRAEYKKLADKYGIKLN